LSLLPGQVLRSDHLNNILRALREATSVISGLEVVPTSPASMNIIVKSGVAIIGGSLVSLGSDTQVPVPTADASYPRFDLVTLKSNGAIGYYVGTPEAAVAVDTAKPETYVKPKPPSTPAGELALAEVFVPAGATAIDKIIDRRIITTSMATQQVTLAPLTADPTLAEGKLWYRSDLDRLQLAVSSTAKREIPWGTINVDAHASRHADGGADEILSPLDLAAIPSPLTGKALDRNEVLKAIQQHKGVFWFNCHWIPANMVSNGVSGTGSITWEDVYATLNTGTTSFSYSYVYKAMGLGATWNKPRYLMLRVAFMTYTYQYAHLVSGRISDYTSSGNTARHIGFKLINGDLYGTVADGTTESTLLLTSLTAATAMTLETVFTPGVECRFYVDGVDKGAITTNLPSGTVDAFYLLYASIYNTEALNKYFRLIEVRVSQLE
jgi:hypothetical protein